MTDIVSPVSTDRLASGELVLVLRCVRSDMTSYGGFRWPESGPVECPSRSWHTYGSKSHWSPEAVCGNGLHGWLWGEGSLSSCNYWNRSETRWLVVEVSKTDVVDLQDKVKFPRGNVVFCGDRTEAAKLISAHAPAGTKVMFAIASAGDRGSASAGAFGHASAGVGGNASAGADGHASAGADGHASAGFGGTASAGDRGTASAGAFGHASAGVGGTASAGDGGSLSIRYFDTNSGKYRRAVAEIDTDGEYKPGVRYHVVGGKLVAMDPQP